MKDRDVLIAAYDDSRGVTAAFNLNLLERINRELSGTIPVEDFRHLIRWNERESRIEMHLQARRDVRFEVAGRSFRIDDGETIHTENSIKYPIHDARHLLDTSGWDPIADWTDERQYFSLILAKSKQ